MASILTEGRQAFTDAVGAPLVGGKLYTYDAGTSTPRPTYADAAGTVPNTNPVVLDARGEATLFWDGAYKVVLKAADDSTIWTVDGIQSSDPQGTGAAAAQALRDDLASTSVGKGAAMVGRGLVAVDTIAALKLLSRAAPSLLAHVAGYYAAGDGGGGVYRLDAADLSTAENGGTVIVASDGGRWKLLYTDMVSIRQFGCNPGQSRSVNSTCLQAAVNWASPINAKLRVPSGTYNFATPVTKGQSFQGINLVGDGYNITRFNYSTFSSGQSMLVIVGGSGYPCGCDISGIGFDGTTSTAAIEICGQCGQTATSCEFGTNAIGIMFHNRDAGSFTEYCSGRDCEFLSTCITAIYYKKTSGNQSFHGSGLSNRCRINTPDHATGAPVIYVGPDCLVYNAPLDAQIWVNFTYTLIQNNNTGSPSVNNCNWHGSLTIEPFGATLVLGSGYTRTYFAGTINSISQNVTYGVFKHVDSVIVDSDGNIRALPKPASKHGIALTTGTNVIDISSWWAMNPSPVSGQSGATKAYIFISGPNYYFAHELTLVHNPYGGAGSAQIVATVFNNNVAAWGAPTYGFDSSDRIVITNSNYPASGVTCDISLSPIGWAQP